MKRLWLSVCLSLILIGIADGSFYSEKAFAQGEITPDAIQGTGVDSPAAVISASAPPTPTTQPAESAKECSIFGDSPIVDCIDIGVSWLIRNTLLRIAASLLWVSAELMNYSIQYGILNFKSWAPDALYPIWVTVRQIVSLAVVFAGLYLGFMYIIGREDTFGKYVGWLVIFALFVNFSYPVTRVLADISNIVSLNLYSAAIGPEALTGDVNDSAGTIIKNRLGLDGLMGSANTKPTNTSLTDINSTPNVLLAVVFVLYAAFIFFSAASIMIARTLVLVLLIVASPLLLIDSVVPKLGEVAAKMRKLFFEQLIVAPVFMVMFALTLKFMDVFRGVGGPMGNLNPIGATGTQTAAVFFNLIMMLIMLHIMLKVTKGVAGATGTYMTTALGKVGGFGLGIASGGTGFLARGTLGAAAARMRDSQIMDKMQGSRTGRGLYSLTNSLAQSTFDTRNIGMVNRGMAAAGLTGMGGVNMQQGLKKNYDTAFKDKMSTLDAKQKSIKDSRARAQYLSQTENSLASRAQGVALKPLGAFGLQDKERKSDNQLVIDKIKEKRAKMLDQYNKIQDTDRKQKFYIDNKADIDLAQEDASMEKAMGETLITATPEGVAPTPEEKTQDRYSTSSGPGGTDTSFLLGDTYQRKPAYTRKENFYTSFAQSEKKNKAAASTEKPLPHVPPSSITEESRKSPASNTSLAGANKVAAKVGGIADVKGPAVFSQNALTKEDVKGQSFKQSKKNKQENDIISGEAKVM